MRKIRLLLPLALVALGGLLAFTGCDTVSSLSGQDSGRTLTLAANTRWVLSSWTDSMGDRVEILPPAPTLDLGYGGRVSGQAGVNRYTGEARVSDSLLDWGAGFALTRRAGPPALMMSENQYLDALRSTRRVTVRGGKLVFTGKSSLRLEYVRSAD